jgi:hypothetical protein
MSILAACGSTGGGAGDGGVARLDGGAVDGGRADGGPAPDGGAADAGTAPDGGSAPDGGLADGGASPDGGTGCARGPAPADRARKVVISHPYLAAGGAARAWEVLELSAAGALSLTGVRFEMGRATDGRIAFTPDGAVGLVAQEDGTLGVFRFDPDGSVHVVHARFEGSFYASNVVVEPAGRWAYVLDANWRENGGGAYRVGIGCDGSLTDLGAWAPSKLLYGLHLLPMRSDSWIAAARDVLTSLPGHDLHLLRLEGSPSWVAGADVFGDDEAIVSALAVTADGRFALVGDNASFSGIPNRIGVAAVSDGGLSAVQVLTPVEDPVAIVPSPYDSAALVVSGFGDAILSLGYNPAQPASPFHNRGPIAYTGARPQLPSRAVLLDRGALRGRVLVAELLGVRQVAFQSDGGVTDLGLTSVGSGNAAITGAIGVQP